MSYFHTKYCLVAYISYVVLLIFLFGVRYGGVFIHLWKVDLPDTRVLVMESDDYGAPSASPRMVNEIIARWSTQHGSIPAEYISQMKWLQNTALNPDNLERLYEVLERHTGAHGRHPAFTANVILSAPDFSKIEEGGFKNYFYIAHDKSEPIVQKWREGIRRGVFYPQLHRREHFAYRRWLQDLRNGRPAVLRLFNKNWSRFHCPVCRVTLGSLPPGQAKRPVRNTRHTWRSRSGMPLPSLPGLWVIPPDPLLPRTMAGQRLLSENGPNGG